LTIGEFIELSKKITKEILIDLMESNPTNSFVEREILSVEEAAEFLKITKSCLYKMNCYRQIPHLKKNKRVLYKRSELIAWLSEARVKTQKEIDVEAMHYIMTSKKK
jgi:excisionase family DNA binding protein